MCVCVYIYIHREREREMERKYCVILDVRCEKPNK